MGEDASRASGRRALVDIAITIVAPTVVLLFLATEGRLGPAWGLVLALAFPIGHASWTLITAGRVSALAVLALISVLLTGGIGLLELPTTWFAIKEALLPLAIGVGCLVSLRTPWPVIPTLLSELLDPEKVSTALAAQEGEEVYGSAQSTATWQLGGIFALTGAATWAYASWMVQAPSGTEAFTSELGRYTALALPVLGIPSTLLTLFVLRTLLVRLEDATGLEVADLLKDSH